MKRVTLTPTPKAGSRTKNRLREHPGIFTLKRTERASCMGGRLSHFVHHPEGWFGWLAADEVEVTSLPLSLEAESL